MRKRLHYWLWSALWEIGDYCLWKAHQIEPDSGEGTTHKLREPTRFEPGTFTATNAGVTRWTITASTWPPPDAT